MNNKIIDAQYLASQHLLHLRLSGNIDSNDIALWNAKIQRAKDEIPNNSVIKCLLDLTGFKAVNIQVHKEFRNIVPSLLLNFNYKIGFIDLFPEAEFTLSSERGICCIAYANAHDDEEKMKKYSTLFNSTTEFYSTNAIEAAAFIASI